MGEQEILYPDGQITSVEILNIQNVSVWSSMSHQILMTGIQTHSSRTT